MNTAKRFGGHSVFVEARNQVTRLDVSKLESDVLIRTQYALSPEPATTFGADVSCITFESYCRRINFPPLS